MTVETQQKILQTLDRGCLELTAWLKSLGVPESQPVEIYDKAVRESGLLLNVLSVQTASMIPGAGGLNVKPRTFSEAIGFHGSEEFGQLLLNDPEPEPEKLNSFLSAIRDLLPRLRAQFASAAKKGPKFRHGGRAKKITSPELQNKVLEEIKTLKQSGVELQDIDVRLSQKYSVSPTTIKRIRLKCGEMRSTK